MQQINLIRKVKKNFALICTVLVVALFISQFAVLATLGTQGSEVSRIRQVKEAYRLENEKLRAKIDGVRTLDQIEQGIQQIYGNSLQKVQPRDVTSQAIEDLDSVGLNYNE